MKKFVSAILVTVILLSSVFSINVFATEDKTLSEIISVSGIVESLNEPSSISDETENDSESGEEIETRFEKWAEKFGDCKEWSLIIYKNAAKAGELYVKGDAAALVEYANGTASQKTIIEGKEKIVCTLQFPSFYYKTNIPEDATVSEISSLFTGSFGEITFEKSYEESGNYVEEFISESYGTILFYFDGEELKNVEISGTNESAQVSYKVKDSDLKVPFFAINITPSINFYTAYFNFIMNIVYGMVWDMMF